LIGPLLAAAISYRVAPYRPRLRIERAATRRLLGFGRWVFLSALLAAVGNLILQAAISRELGAAQLGLYFMAARFAYLPLEVLADVVGTVAFPLYARLQSNVEQATTVFRRLAIGSSAIAYPMLALLIALAPSIDHELLGSSWTGTSAIMRVLSVSAALGLFGDLAVPVYKGLGRPQSVTALELVQSSIVTIVVWPFVTHYGVLGAALAWLPAVLGSQLLNLRLLAAVLRRPLQGLPQRLLAISAISIGAAAIGPVVILVVSGMLGLVVAASTSIVVAAGLLLCLDCRLDLGLVSTVRELFGVDPALLRARLPHGRRRPPR
jgi:O-antigen/teichoic acid export membrane protein